MKKVLSRTLFFVFAVLTSTALLVGLHKASKSLAMEIRTWCDVVKDMPAKADAHREQVMADGALAESKGVPASACPYFESDMNSLYWKQGWMHSRMNTYDELQRAMKAIENEEAAE